jgi:hypothetical protein
MNSALKQSRNPPNTYFHGLMTRVIIALCKQSLFILTTKDGKKSPASRINQDLELGIRFWILEASH